MAPEMSWDKDMDEDGELFYWAKDGDMYLTIVKHGDKWSPNRNGRAVTPLCSLNEAFLALKGGV